MSMKEYLRKCDELSVFGPNLIDTPLKKNKKFVAGMRKEFHKIMTAHIKESFMTLVDVDLRYENLMKEEAALEPEIVGNVDHSSEEEFHPKGQ